MTTTATNPMTAAQMTAPGRSRILEAEVPAPGPNEVLIEVARAGICGTDIHIWHGDYELANFPLIPGHEFAGTVAAVGDLVTRYKVGDRVTADPNVPCLTCPECQRNAFNQCHDLTALGVTTDGAFAHFMVAPERNVFPIGDLSFQDGALIEPLACVVWGLKRVQVQPGDHAIVFGAGPMGCLLMQAVKGSGASSVTVVDRSPKRLEMATRLGADHVFEADGLTPEATRGAAPHGFEVVADATGIPKVMQDAIAYARPAGTLWVFGVAPESSTFQLSPYELFRRDLRVVGTFAINRTFQEAIEMIKGGVVDVKPLVSHTVPLTEFEAGLDLAEHDPDRMKVQFDVAGS